MSFMDDFEHLKIQLEDIKLATNNFGRDKLIGRGGFGQVYKGELSLDGRQTMVAFKCLDRKHGQGDTEFWKEVLMLSRYRHENLVSLMHFCSEGEHKILVYEYAFHGSLDTYLANKGLTWTQRLKICIGAACGLNYLHDPSGTQQRVLHRDIKSSNILLDENWNAKLSDFGLSKLGPANQQHTYLISNVVGTPGYCDPLYWEMGFLSKESDVYSFGVVLFEVMCGRLCFEYSNGQLRILVRMWQKLYDEKRLDEIIFQDLKENMDSDSLNTFSSIAYKCLKREREERPTMAEIVKELEIALDQQEFSEDVRKRVDFEEISKILDLAIPPVSYRSQKELFLLLSKGILLSGGKSWLSINKNGEQCEMVSAAESIFEYTSGYDLSKNYEKSRFPSVVFHMIDGDFGLEADTKFLSTHVTYTINLVFKHHLWDNGPYVPFKYKLEEEEEYSTSCVAHLREDGWLMTELYQFTSYQKEHKFRIRFVRPSYYSLHRNLVLEGIEFRPVEHEKHQNLKDEYNVDIKPISSSEIEKMSCDHPEITKWLEDRMHSTSNKELLCLLRKGCSINNGEKWFFIDENMKKCHMLPARAILQEEKWTWKPLQESRFDMVAESQDTNSFSIACVIESQLLSPQTTYASYLLYKLPKNHHSVFEGPIEVENIDLKIDFITHKRLIYLITPPHVPIIRPQLDHLSQSPLSTRKIKGHPRLRKDGWMELKVWEFPGDFATTISMRTCFKSCDKWKFTGFSVQGIEFRPL
ncbi:uncharacterized protein LOC111908543 [Lactuca sativa]|uniref:uncharacterized protein LOC111908543 n=1 Tax=Lactuca sativa TaxID=4236 RepID=UPI000CC006A5|nr:uncharacterized protein LOC111908543 [Lactuca sativa]